LELKFDVESLGGFWKIGRQGLKGRGIPYGSKRYIIIESIPRGIFKLDVAHFSVHGHRQAHDAAQFASVNG
jgi:hypothetical protein